MNNKSWSKDEIEGMLKAYRSSGLTLNAFSHQWAKSSGRTYAAVSSKLHQFKAQDRLPVLSPSPYPSYDEPLEMEGDALILTDVEFPFHHAVFLNDVLHLAKTWGIKNLILGGDVLHFESLSGWEPPFVGDPGSTISEDMYDQLLAFAHSLGSRQQGQLVDLLSQATTTDPAKNVSEELSIARRELRKIEAQFDRVDMCLGNHEGRLLRALEAAMSPSELLRLLEAGDKWRLSPYYFSILHSGGETFQIEHPRNTAKFSAWKLASKYQRHVIMGHSHQLNFTMDISGKFYAIECGHCVDETKLPYAAQRHTTAYQHVLGCVIVREGYPYLLHPGVDWEKLEKMA